VTASLLEGAFALSLEPVLTIENDSADGEPPRTIYIQEATSPSPPPGVSSEDWLLIRQARFDF
jgi:hypothetical protein